MTNIWQPVDRHIAGAMKRKCHENMTEYLEGGGAIPAQGKRVSSAKYALQSLRDALKMPRQASSSLSAVGAVLDLDDARGAVKPKGDGFGAYVVPPAFVVPPVEGRGLHDSDDSDDDNRMHLVKARVTAK